MPTSDNDIMCISPNMMYRCVNHTGKKEYDFKWHFAPFDIERFKSYQKSKLYQCVMIPCGHCKECRKTYSSQWAYRLMKESEYYKYKYFITLTYDESKVPVNNLVNTLRREDLRTFIKSLTRHLHRENKDFSYSFFSCGEYGSRTFRPHYHLVFMCSHEIPTQKYHVIQNGDNIEYVPVVSCNKHSLVTSDLLEHIWSKGLISIGEVTSESCAYVAGYTAKKYDSEEIDYSKLGIETPFVSMTKGIGKRYYNANYSKLLDYDNDFIVSRGHAKRVALPRYFDKLTERMYLDKYQDVKDMRYVKSKSDYLNLAFKSDKDIINLYKSKKLTAERSKIIRK